MKRPNGSGGIRKLAGRRRHPYQVVVSSGHEIRDNKIVVRQTSLGCYATRKEALEALAEWQTNHLRVDLRYMTVEDIYKKIRPYLKESTILSYDPTFKKYSALHKTRLIDIKTYTIEEIPIPPLRKGTYDKIRAFWHAIFEYGIENDIVNKDYSQFLKFRNVKPSRKKEVFSLEEIKDYTAVPLYKILLYTGMRINELLNMETSDVYEEDGILCFHVTKSKTESGIRTIPVHSAIMNDIDLSQQYVIEPHLPYAKVKDAFNETRNGNHTLHDFRRTFASYAKSCGADDYYVKCLLGHVHKDITHDVYTEAFVKDLKREIEKIRFL